MSRAKFEYTCRANSVISEYLDNCRFMDDMYILDVDKPHYQYMADRLTGAWWAFQEQERANIKAKAFLKVEIALLKIKLVKLEHKIQNLEADRMRFIGIDLGELS